MSLEKISSQLKHSGTEQKLPPVELWDPPYCGEMNLVIKKDGSWYHNGTVFKRQKLVKLFASVLKKERDDYFLVTPVEKIKITVEDVPFILSQWSWGQEGEYGDMHLATNLGDEFIFGENHPLHIADNGCLYVTVRRNLLAKVHRNVFYQWADLAKERITPQGTELILPCGGHELVLGRF
ncbi:DUF1285 domain-containing protein [Thalassomonas actiniarum]|uniref:DUF1285 domain-containing protein n=1 Tax=Thalassomonas actiniarum TaxID=485447 RepID=A0AAE9YLF8_9GAMM|nr:DUF1285 domain-containing protein [Thalassomonas actiniarum]WDD96838.1 DUF1285 domain-containing protein [Thalassomonas actiniarum]